MIPKIIHYCWFGGNPLPETALKCIASWRKYCPDYEIKEWNETNYDVRKIPYIAQAYATKKYAFVSDYARFDILYEYGGIYFDVDVEVIKPIDDLIEKGAFAGIESHGALNAGLGLASRRQEPIFAEILESYSQSCFLRPNGSMDLTTVVVRVSEIFRQYGFTNKNEIQTIKDITIYPVEYFNPKNQKTGELKITPNTYSIHHFDASWAIPLRRKYITYRRLLSNKIGYRIADVILLPMQLVCVVQEIGLSGLIKKIFNVLSLGN